MPQSLTTAPLNPSPRWPSGYVEVLREAGAQEKTIPFCMGWVRRFFAAHPGRRRRDLGRAEIEAFLRSVADHAGVSNWQLQQARDALEVYYERFRGIAWAPRPDAFATHTTNPSASEAPGAAPQIREKATPLTALSRHYAETQQNVKSVSGPFGIQDQAKPRATVARGGDGGKADVAGRQTTSGKVNWRALEAKVVECLRMEHYSYRTEQTYVGWIRRFVEFHDWRKPSQLEAADVQAFLKHLVLDRQVSASTQNQALNAVVFLYRKLINKDLGDFSDFPRARMGLRLPVVASRDEVKAVIDRLQGREQLIARLLYGTGMRIHECLGMRIQDVYFDQNRIVAHGKGNKDRYVPLPAKHAADLRSWLERRKALYEADKTQNMHEVEVPGALARKYPNAPFSWGWQYVFPADSYSEDPRSGHVRRHHLDEQQIERVVQEAVRQTGLTVRFTPHLLEAGQDIRTVQALLGHAHVETTMIYTHVLNKGPMGVISPVDTL